MEGPVWSAGQGDEAWVWPTSAGRRDGEEFVVLASEIRLPVSPAWSGNSNTLKLWAVAALYDHRLRRRLKLTMIRLG